MNCPECNSDKATKCGYSWRNREKIRRWRCSQCKRIFVEPAGEKEDDGKKASRKAPA